MKVLEILDKKFGKLLVIRRVEEDKWGLAHWECVCDCGNTRVVSGRNLVNGKTISCGCYRREFIRSNQKPHGHSLLKREFSNYKRGAISRARVWGLSFERFKELSLDKCYYCGSSDSKLLKRDRQSLRCNGIDRLENHLGYIEGNVVACCSPCNYLKLDRDHDEFLLLIESIYKHLEKKRTL